MKLENLTIRNEDKREDIINAIEKLPKGFVKLKQPKVSASIGENKEIYLNFEEEFETPLEISIPTFAKDIQISSYHGDTVTEFYYKSTKYQIRFN